jgi:hypothetical protein
MCARIASITAIATRIVAMIARAPRREAPKIAITTRGREKTKAIVRAGMMTARAAATIIGGGRIADLRS